MVHAQSLGLVVRAQMTQVAVHAQSAGSVVFAQSVGSAGHEQLAGLVVRAQSAGTAVQRVGIFDTVRTVGGFSSVHR